MASRRLAPRKAIKCREASCGDFSWIAGTPSERRWRVRRAESGRRRPEVHVTRIHRGSSSIALGRLTFADPGPLLKKTTGLARAPSAADQVECAGAACDEIARLFQVAGLTCKHPRRAPSAVDCLQLCAAFAKSLPPRERS